MLIVHNKGHIENVTISGSQEEVTRMFNMISEMARRMNNVDIMFMDCTHDTDPRKLTMKPRHNV